MTKRRRPGPSQPLEIPPGPVATAYAVAAQGELGKRTVLLQMMTPVGAWVFFLDAACARAMAADLEASAGPDIEIVRDLPPR